MSWLPKRDKLDSVQASAVDLPWRRTGVGLTILIFKRRLIGFKSVALKLDAR